MPVEPVEPRLEWLLRVDARLGEMRAIGDVVPGVLERTVMIDGGSVEGAVTGEILPGGADWQQILPDGTALIDTRYTLRTDGGALVDVRTRGSRTGPEAVLRSLTSVADVDPSTYDFRLVVALMTADPDLAWLNHRVIVASAVRAPGAVVYDAYLLR